MKGTTVHELKAQIADLQSSCKHSWINPLFELRLYSGMQYIDLGKAGLSSSWPTATYSRQCQLCELTEAVSYHETCIRCGLAFLLPSWPTSNALTAALDVAARRLAHSYWFHRYMSCPACGLALVWTVYDR